MMHKPEPSLWQLYKECRRLGPEAEAAFAAYLHSQAMGIVWLGSLVALVIVFVSHCAQG